MIREFIQSSPPVVAAIASVVLTVHVSGGAVGLVSGAGAAAVTKGSRLHRRLGSVFVVAMATMAISGVAIAPFMPRAQWMNMAGGLFTLYLVVTAWAAVKAGVFARQVDAVAPVIPIAIIFAAFGVGFGFLGRVSTGQAIPLYMFAGLSSLAIVLDCLRAFRPEASGPAKVARHLWRMCLALAIGAAAFFLGQADTLPEALRGPHLSLFPLAAIVLLAVYMVRLRALPALRTYFRSTRC